MSVQLYKRLMTVLLAIYAMALFTSMAGLEITIWTLMALLLFGLYRGAREPEAGWPKAFRLGVLDWVLAWLFLAVVMSWFVNRNEPDVDPVQIIGAARWILTLYGMTFILAWFKADQRWFKPYLLAIFVGNIYAYVTAATGWDFVRSREVAFKLETAMSIFPRAVGFLGSPMPLGHSGALALMMVSGVLLVRLKATKRFDWTLAVVAVTTAVTIALTFTRGAWLSSFCGLFVIAVILGRRYVLGVIAACFVIYTTAFFVSSRYFARLNAVTSTTEYSNSIRVQIWENNWAMIKDHPVFGVGLHRNEDIAPQYYEKRGVQNGFVGHAHNNVIQYFAGTGVFGGFAYLTFALLYFVLTVRLWRSSRVTNLWHRELLLGLIGAQISMHVGGLSETTFKTMLINHHFTFLLALVGALAWVSGETASAKTL